MCPGEKPSRRPVAPSPESRASRMRRAFANWRARRPCPRGWRSSNRTGRRPRAGTPTPARARAPDRSPLSRARPSKYCSALVTSAWRAAVEPGSSAIPSYSSKIIAPANCRTSLNLRLRHAALVPGDARLPQHAADARQDGEQRDGRGRAPARCRATKRCSAIRERPAAREHRPSIEVAPEIGGEFLGRRVALLRLRPRRLHHDRVEIAREPRRGLPGDRRAGRHATRDGAGSLGVRLRSVGQAAGQQLAADDAQGVDVARGGRRQAAQLLGAGVGRRGEVQQRHGRRSRRRSNRGPAPWRCRSRGAAAGRRPPPGCSPA